MNEKVIKILGIAASALGVISTLAAEWVSDKKQNSVIEQKVMEALAKTEKK